MKIIILSIVFLFSVLDVFGQQPSTTVPDRAYYLKKSNTQKVFAWLLLGGGIGLVIAGSAISDTYAGDYSPWMEVGGGVMAASSIPFFVASSKNRKKAESMVLAMGYQTYAVPCNDGSIGKVQPAVFLKIKIGR